VRLAVLPFRWIAAGLGDLSDGRAAATIPAADPALEAEARRIGRAVERAARHLPWRTLCLPQAIAAKAMLAHRGIPATVHFGMALREGSAEFPSWSGHRMLAHAWLTAGRANVVGASGAGRFAVVARFSNETGGAAQ
jgi:hypothetical protein